VPISFFLPLTAGNFTAYMSKRTNDNTPEPRVEKRIRSNAHRPGFRASRLRDAEVEQVVAEASQIRKINTHQGRTRSKTKKRVHATTGGEPNASTSTTDTSPQSSTTIQTSTSKATPPPPAKRKRDRATTQTKLVEWLDLHDSTLDELLRLDGLGPALEVLKCWSCLTGEGTHRCLDCGHGTRLLCVGCMVTKHCELELHRVEVSMQRNILFYFVC